MKIRTTTLPCPECGQALYKPDRSGYHLIHRCSKCGMDYSAEEVLDHCAVTIEDLRHTASLASAPKFKSGTAYTAMTEAGEFPKYAPGFTVPWDKCNFEVNPEWVKADAHTSPSSAGTAITTTEVEGIAWTNDKREEDPMRTTLWRVTLVDRRSGEVLYTEMIVAQNEREAAFKVGVDVTIREHSVEYDDIEIVFEHITDFNMKEDEKPTRVQIVESAEDPRG